MALVYSSYEDVILLRLLSGGDDEAFTEIYNRYWEKLLYVAGIKCRHLGIAEEIVQDIFLDLWNRRTGLNITGSLEGYLAASVKYRVINAQVKMKNGLAYQKHAIRNLSQQENTTEHQLNFHELQARLEKLVGQLPEKCRITYKLKEDGLSQKEIAAHLHITEKGVEANLARAMKTLRVSLKHFLSCFL